MSKFLYHGTSSAANIRSLLLPPSTTGILSEKGRNKNLDKIFFTGDLGLAKVYAGRAVNSLGGDPEIFRVILPFNMSNFSSVPGASIFMADWAFCEKYKG